MIVTTGPIASGVLYVYTARMPMTSRPTMTMPRPTTVVHVSASQAGSSTRSHIGVTGAGSYGAVSSVYMLGGTVTPETRAWSPYATCCGSKGVGSASSPGCGPG